jgi:hypothetical protein
MISGSDAVFNLPLYLSRHVCMPLVLLVLKASVNLSLQDPSQVGPPRP